MFKRILVPLDGSERAEQALPVAARIARRSGGTIILVQVVDIMAFSYSHVTHPVMAESFIDISLNGAKQYLVGVGASSMFSDIPIEMHVPFGTASSQILSVAEASQADSIVLTSHGYTGLARWVLGSVAEYVVRHGSVPVLVLREDNALLADLPESKRPVGAVVPLDGSFIAKEALEPAAALVSLLAAPEGGVLHLVRVEKPEAEENTIRNAERYLRLISDEARETLSETSNLTISWSVVVNEDAADGIVSVAEHGEHREGENISGSYDLIAMTTYGRTGLQRWIMGSVAQSIIGKSNLPLLVVRPSEVAAEGEEQGREFPLTRPGAVYPEHYIMASFENMKEGRETVQALQNTGIAADDIRLFESQEVIEYAENTEKTRSLRSRIADVIQAITSDEDAHVLVYVQEALRGHPVINVYAPTDEQVEQVKNTLLAHNAHNVKYFGRWAITILHR